MTNFHKALIVIAILLMTVGVSAYIMRSGPGGSFPILPESSSSSEPALSWVSAEAGGRIPGEEPGVECRDSSKYFVVQKDVADSVGSDILVKYKSNPNENFSCIYAAREDDFEIKNASAEYFLALSGNFLMLDSGTAPEPRELIVYDLAARKIVFSDLYAGPVEAEGGKVTYFSKTAQKPTLLNCPDLAAYEANGLGAVIMSRVMVDLSLLKKADLGAFKCLATQ